MSGVVEANVRFKFLDSTKILENCSSFVNRSPAGMLNATEEDKFNKGALNCTIQMLEEMHIIHDDTILNQEPSLIPNHSESY